MANGSLASSESATVAWRNGTESGELDDSSAQPAAASSEAPFVPAHNPGSVVPYATMLAIDHAMLCWVSPLVFFTGVPTNVLNCLVFARQGLGDRMNLTLFTLAVADMLVVALSMLMSTPCLVGTLRPDLDEWLRRIIVAYVVWLRVASRCVSAFLTMMVSVERCICVFMPMRAASLVTTRTTAILIAATSLFFLLVSLEFPLKYRPAQLQLPDNTTRYIMKYSDLYNEHPGLFHFLRLIVTVILPCVAFVVVLVATVLTVIQLKRLASRRRQMMSQPAGSRRELALSRLLVIVSFIFITTDAPRVAVSLAEVSVDGFDLSGRYSNLFTSTQVIAKNLNDIGCSVNFFVYMNRSSKFKKELSLLFPRCCSAPVSETPTPQLQGPINPSSHTKNTD